MDHLVEVVKAEQVDVVLIAGDIYDRAIPPPEAVEVCGSALSRLARDTAARIVLISGNHDSPQRLGFAHDLIDAAGVHLRTDLATVGAPILLDDATGPVAIYPIPYLVPQIARNAWELERASHHAALGGAMARIRADLATRPGTRSVVMAHAFVIGGEGCDSERDVSVGGVADAPVVIFEAINYVALGHLHGHQQVGSATFYSGSPLAYSFSEHRHRKGSLLVDLDAGGPVRTELIPAPVPRRLELLEGALEELLTDPRHADKEDCWLSVRLTDARRPLEAMSRLRRRFPHTLRLDFSQTAAPPVERVRLPVATTSPQQVVSDFVEYATGTPATAAEIALLNRAVEASEGHDQGAA